MLSRCLPLLLCIGMAACAEQAEPQNTEQTPATAPASGLIAGTPDGDLDQWVADIRTGIKPLAEEAAVDGAAAQRKALDLYITRQEYIEMYYGPGGRLQGTAELGDAIESAETAFHNLMQLLGKPPVDAAAARQAVAELDARQAQVLAVWQKGDKRLDRTAAATAVVNNTTTSGPLRTGRAETEEIRDISAAFTTANEAYAAGDVERARTTVLNTYLDKFEPIESRLPSSVANRIEHLIHVEIRTAMNRGDDAAKVAGLFATLNSALLDADDHLQQGGTFWFAAINSFVIILREGLEAVLLVGALLGYLIGIGAPARHRRQIWAGVGAGVVASLITWGVASALIPINGANRELIEGATALIAVAVLLYVSNWLFQKTYIHDWKNYLREKLNSAVSSKSAFAMMFLAFAAVYREGFETVLFYQALAFDASAAAVFAGFLPGLVLISIVGVLIIRAGARLPLKQMFGVTNAILVYLAFVFVGKGLYNLHEAGVFAARQLPLPDVQILELVFGWYPLLETTVAQAAYLTLIAATFIFYRRRLAVATANAK